MKKKIENLSMQTQLTVVILSVIVLAFGIILYSGYSGQARSFAEEYTSSTQTILEMDVANLDLIAQFFVVIAVKNVKVGIIVRQPFHCLIQNAVFQRKISELLVRGDVLMK